VWNVEARRYRAWTSQRTFGDIQPPTTVRCILDLRGGGMSYDRIAKQLNADGVTGKAGGKFYASTVHKIVGNDLHA
jgi:hypothetical protein